eukprot:TRINITY_DN6307_c0_g1_i11.p1 TRINITY_DN6307_c0_g1~~TRINITY_DN6307_c0_g1_i11.p1  ORF type:complete len:342 (-),score=70.63 TRINITY_DN6307_c0_g1_i11:191-1216(-)
MCEGPPKCRINAYGALWCYNVEGLYKDGERIKIMNSCRDSHLIFSELYDDKKLREHRNTKVDFLKTEESFLRGDLKAVKKTLSINKEIISTLIKERVNPKEIISKLNEENVYLLKQIKLLKSQRDTYHRKNFLANQIIAELKHKARNDFKDYKDTAINFLDELDCKEFVIQNLQYKYNRLEEVVRKYAKQDAELAELLKDFDSDRLKHSKRITGIVCENKKLSEELARCGQRLHELEGKLRNREVEGSIDLDENDFKEVFIKKDEYSKILVETERCLNSKVNDNTMSSNWTDNLLNNKLSSISTSKASSINLELDKNKCDITADDNFADIFVILEKRKSYP